MLSNPTDVRAGDNYSCAIDDTGLVCWGNDEFKQLSAPDLLVPNRLTAGRFHGCAIQGTSIACWGRNSAGQANVPGVVFDRDKDGVSNRLDNDNDNDGVPDNVDAFPLDASETTDTDGDGVGDNADVFPDDSTETVDTDEDGIGDAADTDDDGDQVADDQEIIDGTDPLNRHDCRTCFHFDIDVDGDTSALTDGLLVLRHLFGFAGTTLTDGALATSAVRTDGETIGSYLNNNTGNLDIDGDGSTTALTDGLLLLRYLFGFDGSTLIDGALGNGAARETAEDIKSFIQARISTDT